MIRGGTLVLLALLLSLPVVAADPLPVPTPDPHEPTGGEDHLDELEELLKRIIGNGNPIDEECWGLREDAYELNEEPSVPAAAQAGTRVLFMVWHEGTRHEGWVDVVCMAA